MCSHGRRLFALRDSCQESEWPNQRLFLWEIERKRSLFTCICSVCFCFLLPYLNSAFEGWNSNHSLIFHLLFEQKLKTVFLCWLRLTIESFLISEKTFSKIRVSNKSVLWYRTSIFYTWNKNNAKLYSTLSFGIVGRVGSHPNASVYKLGNLANWTFMSKAFLSCWVGLNQTITWAEDVLFPPVSVGLVLLVCYHDYNKTTGRIPMKLGLRIGLSPEQNPINFWCGSRWRDGSRVYLGGWYPRVLMQFHADPKRKIRSNGSKYVLFDFGLGLIELQRTAGPWRRYTLYWIPF